MSKKLIKPTVQEDLKITAASLSDADNVPLSNDEWNRVKSSLKRGPGRPMGSGTKVQLTLRVDAEVVAALRASGAGWQTRANEILRKAVLA